MRESHSTRSRESKLPGESGPEIKVFISSRESTCSECGENLGSKAWITLAGRERAIADHACRKYSGRIGRSASAKAMDEQAVRLAVIAHVRHRKTTAVIVCEVMLALPPNFYAPIEECCRTLALRQFSE